MAPFPTINVGITYLHSPANQHINGYMQILQTAERSSALWQK